MKSVWNGVISFGLVTIPVALVSAVEPQMLGFHMLCNKCHSRLHYKRLCRKCNKEVPWVDVVKGLELAKNKYFVLTRENLARLKPAKSDVIEIIRFIDAHQIDPVYYNKHYFVVPTKHEKAYYLFQEVLRSSAKVAIGRFVMKEKEYACSIEAYKHGLLLTTLNYEYEVRDINKELGSPPKLSHVELKLARQIIDKFYGELDISEFRDTFAENVRKIIEGKAVKVKKVPKLRLMAALKASVR